MSQIVLYGLGLLLLLAPARAGGAPAAPRPASGNGMTSAAQALLARPVDAPAFTEGLALLQSRSEPAHARRMVLEKMHGARRGLDSRQARALLDAATALARDGAESPTLAAQAIDTMASLNLLLLERGELTPAQTRQEAPFLMTVAGDAGRAREMRGRALRALADLKAGEAVPLLRRLLADPAADGQPEVTRNGSLALARLSPETALEPLTALMRRTADRSVFGSAAFAVGQLRTADAMAALAGLQDRFPDSDSCAAALAELEAPILAVLANPADPRLEAAIRASANLWKQGQRERLVPLLHGLLATAPAAARAAAVERLLGAAGALDPAAENRELRAILAQIAGQPELGVQTGQIRRRLAAKPLEPTGQTIPAPPLR